MRPKRRAEVAFTIKRCRARVTFDRLLRSLAASICASLLLVDTCVSMSLAQSAPQSKPPSPAPDIVAPVSPPPVTPPSANRAGSAPSSGNANSQPHDFSKKAGTDQNAKAAPGSHPNYDPLNPVTSTGEIDQRFVRWTPKNAAPTPGPQKGANPVGKSALPQVSPNPTAAAPAAGKNGNPPKSPVTSTPAVSGAVSHSANPSVKTEPLPSGAAGAPVLKPQVPKIAEPAPAPDINKGTPASTPAAASSSNGNQISGNTIGLNVVGNGKLANQDGIYIENAAGTLIGGT
ncbi:MAG TPA: hypothetical protein PKZ32_01790, partial [Candidatus Melainabacteria bacterium]|nr:hypothetical protein [Candidatus Melainabacteria bacterium]